MLVRRPHRGHTPRDRDEARCARPTARDVERGRRRGVVELGVELDPAEGARNGRNHRHDIPAHCARVEIPAQHRRVDRGRVGRGRRRELRINGQRRGRRLVMTGQHEPPARKRCEQRGRGEAFAVRLLAAPRPARRTGRTGRWRRAPTNPRVETRRQLSGLHAGAPYNVRNTSATFDTFSDVF